MKTVKTYSPKTKILSLILSFLIIFYLVPNSVFAEGLDNDATVSDSSVSVSEENSTYTPEIYEVTELREENVKHFRLEDGSYVAAQYNYPVHYTDENGEFTDINNRLEEGAGGEYSNSNTRVSFVKKITGSGKLFTFAEDDVEVSISVLNSNKGIYGSVTNCEDSEEFTELQKKMNLENLSSKVLYEEVFDGVDIEYVVQSLDIKENIIVKERSDEYTYSFEIKLKNLTPTLADDGSILLSDNEGTAKYIIPAPVVYDAAYTFAEDGIANYSLEGKNNKYTLTVTVDPEWMNSESTLFPVTVDPTITIVDDTPYKRGLLPSLMCVQPQVPLEIIMSDVLVLPDTATLASATMSLQYRGSGGFFRPRIRISDTLTNEVYAINQLYGGYTWDITELISKWWSNSWTSRSLTLSVYNSMETLGLNVPIWFTIPSSNFVTINTPIFEINYTNVMGIEDYYSYSSHSLTNSGNGSVNLATGKLTFASDLTSTTDYIMPLTISAVYNSVMSNKNYTFYNTNVPFNNSYMAYGFKLNIAETFVKKNIADNNDLTFDCYVLSDGDGTEHYFYFSGTEYCDASSLGRKIRVSDNDELILTYKNHLTKTFSKIQSTTSGTSAGWVLSKITDAMGNSVVIDLGDNGQPTMVSLLPKGHSEGIELLSFSYINNKLSKIHNLGNNETVTFRYSTNYNGSILSESGNYLRSIEYGVIDSSTDTNKTKTQFTYNSVGYVTNVADTLSGHCLEYIWDNNQLTAVTHNANSKIGQTVEYVYGNGHADVITSGNDEDISTDEDNVITRYIFDNLGRSVSVYSIASDGSEIYGASVGKYETKENAKNNIKEIATIGGSTANYIVNGSFELGTEYWYTSGLSSNKNSKYFSTGKYCMEISPSTTGQGIISQNVYLDSGNYTLSLKYAVPEAAEEEIYLRIIGRDGTTIAEKQLPVDKAHTLEGFSFASMSFEVDYTRAVTVAILVQSEGGKKVYLDDVMLEKGLGVGEYNIIQSGGFEDSHINENFAAADITFIAWETDNVENISNESFSDPFSRTIGISNGSIKQTIYSSELQQLDPKKTYRISGFAYAPEILCGGNFRLCVDVYYRQNSGEDVLVSNYFNFTNAEGTWQFVSGLFSGEPDSSKKKSGINYSVISKIDIICEFSGQEEGYYAYFDNISLIDASNSSITQYGYDSRGNLCMEKGLYDTVYYNYDSNNNLVSVYRNSRNDELIEYSYNNLNLVTKEVYKTIDAEGILKESITEYSYNDYGQPTSTTVTGGESVLYSSFDYDLTTDSKFFGALTESTDTTGAITKYYYCPEDGRLKATLTEESGMAYSYDTMGRLIKTLPATISEDSYSPVTNAENVNYTYTPEGFLSTITTDSTTYTFTYDAFGNAEDIKAGSNTLATYEYNDYNGKLTKVIYGNGYVVEYLYNSLELLERVCYTNNSNKVAEYEYVYTRDGQLHSIKDMVKNTYTVFEYDTGGKLLGSYEYNEADYVTEFVSTYEYDASNGTLSHAKYKWNYTAGGKEQNVLSDSEYTYNHDSSVSLYQLTVGAVSFDATYIYDEFKRIDGVDYLLDTGSTMSEQYTYAEIDGYTSGLVEQYIQTIGNSSSTYNYTYDSKGNITSIYDGTYTTTYRYDDLGQLVYEKKLESPVHLNYYYDAAGNIVQKVSTMTIMNQSHRQVVIYGYSDSQWGDLLTSYDGHAITYDPIDNPLTYYNGSAYSFTWEGRRLASAIKGSNTMSFTYNDEGIRTSKTVNGARTEYILNGSQILAEITDSYTIAYIYDAYGSPIGMQYKDLSDDDNAWEVYWYGRNLQGDIVAVYDNSGTQLAAYYYSTAWGDHVVEYVNGGESTGAQYNPFRYRGYYYDTNLGMYYLQSRYYDPNTCRFINADSYASTGQGLIGYNMFAYCGNNPVNRIDPMGNAWYHWALGAAIVVACAAATVITCGGFAAAATAVCMVGSGFAAATTASTIAAAAFIGSATVYGSAAFLAASTSHSVNEFNDQGNWGTVLSTAGGAVFSGVCAYFSTKASTTQIYRSVSNAEAQDIKNTGKFNLSPYGMESKQFGFNLEETRQFGNKMGQDIIVSAKIPTSMLGQFYTGGVDTSIFRSGTLTIYGEQLDLFNQLVAGTIKILP